MRTHAADGSSCYIPRNKQPQLYYSHQSFIGKPCLVEKTGA